MEIGDSVRISNVTLPEGVKPSITDRDFVIASIGAPTQIVQEEAAEEDDMDVPTIAEDDAAKEEGGEE